MLIKCPTVTKSKSIYHQNTHICWPLFRKGLPFYVICDYENTSATMWQLKRVHRQKIGQFWAWRQTDTKRGLGTWKSLGLAGIQGESGPVVWCTGPIRLGEGEGVAWLELILCDWSNLQGYLQGVKQLNVTERVVFIGTVSLVSSYQEEANGIFI